MTSTTCRSGSATRRSRSEEHTSELQSRSDLVCRLLLEKKKIMLPVFEMDEHVEIFRRGTCANTEVVTLPGDVMRIQKIHHDWPIEAAPFHGVGRIATGGSRHE